MRKLLFLLSVFLLISCNPYGNNESLSPEKQEEFKLDTKELFDLQDSLNRTGDMKYYDKYMLCIDTMIKKYPGQRSLVKLKKHMQHIFEY